MLFRTARRAAYPCGVVIADRPPGEEADIERLHLFVGPTAENAAGSLHPATITSVVRDHAKSIVRLREARSNARTVDDLDVSISHEISNIFSRVWTPSKPVLHLAIALSVDVEEKYPGEARWGKQLSMLANPSWLANCIHRAEVFRTVHAPLMTPLGVGPHDMIQVLSASSRVFETRGRSYRCLPCPNGRSISETDGMIVWRLMPRRHANSLDGAGNRDSGARWNSGRGRGVVYASLNVATCVLEAFVHFGPILRAKLPDNLMLVEIRVPEDAGVLRIEADEIPADADLSGRTAAHGSSGPVTPGWSAPRPWS